MNAKDIMHYGHQTVLAAVAEMPVDTWEVVGATTAWSIKDVVAHLASSELVLAEVLATFLGDATSTPMLERYRDARFNDDEVEKRRANSPVEVLAEYSAACQQVMELAARIPADDFRQVGTISWYGPEYVLDDFVVYAFYGHKREHCAQIKMHRRKLKRDK